MQSIRIPIVKLTPNLPTPKYAYPGDAGVDLCAASDITLKPFERAAVPCGISIAIPEGYAGLIIPRSGLAAKHGISIVNSPGLIDSNYRGELKALLVNLDPNQTFNAQAGDRIAQLLIVKADPIIFAESESLSETSRGSKGFGSSGLGLDRPV